MRPGRAVFVLAMFDCDLEPYVNHEGQPYSFDLGVLGTGTGVGCIDADGDGAGTSLGCCASRRKVMVSSGAGRSFVLRETGPSTAPRMKVSTSGRLTTSESIC